MSDDYLWDRSGEPDKDTQQLESVLATLRYEEPLREPVVQEPRMARWAPLAAAAATVIGIGLGSLQWLTGNDQPRGG